MQLEEVWDDSDAVLDQASGSFADLLQMGEVQEELLDEGEKL